MSLARQESNISYSNLLRSILEKVVVVWREFPKSAKVRYLVQDNMIRRAMRRILKSARRLDRRYDCQDPGCLKIAGEMWSTKIRTSCTSTR